MKLVYLWVESYEFINRQGFLLNSGYEVKKAYEGMYWEITKKIKLDPLLYGENVDVTAIVGDNGAGKSTLLDIIRLMLFDKENREKKIKGFLVWEDNDELGMISQMDEIPLVKYDGKIKNTVLPQDYNLIYYSDFLDLKYFSEDFDDGEDKVTYIEEIGEEFSNRNSLQINISTSHLIKKYSSNVKDYFHSDIKKQITYFNEQKEQKLLVSMPQRLFVKMEFLDMNILDGKLDTSLSDYYTKGNWRKDGTNVDSILIEVLKKMEKTNYFDLKNVSNPRHEMDVIRWNIWVTYLLNLLDERQNNHEEYHDYRYIDNILLQLLPPFYERIDVYSMVEYVFEHFKAQDTEFELYIEFYNKLLDCMVETKTGEFDVTFSIPDDIFSNIKEHKLWKYIESEKGGIENKEQIYMERCGWNGKWKLESFMNLYDSYIKICYEVDFLKFSWGLSTGEGNMFNLFARLYQAMKVQEKEKILLLFDELDSSFHPQWQQEIVKELTNFLRNVYPYKTFQIILTTHSPVLLSDIPKDNVLFVKKNNVLRKEHTQTFAANIASLYYDSFFMDKGSIGKVAKDTISNLLDTISEMEKIKGVVNKEDKLLSVFMNKQFPNTKRNNIEQIAHMPYSGYLIKKLIDNIGEDIWRYKINEKYHHFLNQDEEVLEKELWMGLKALEEKKGKESVYKLFVSWKEDRR